MLNISEFNSLMFSFFKLQLILSFITGLLTTRERTLKFNLLAFVKHIILTSRISYRIVFTICSVELLRLIKLGATVAGFLQVRRGGVMKIYPFSQYVKSALSAVFS